MNKELAEKLQRIEIKIDSVKKMLKQYLNSEKTSDFLLMKPSNFQEAKITRNNRNEAPVNVYLLRLPDSLRQTMFAMDKLKDATAFEVSRETGRSRSVESFHLNQLERMGYLVKVRRGKKIYFKVPQQIIKKTRKMR